mmetsp:Transcript_7066/g.14564  ORF Transcript_7066/g.14564 Transcript_7066/m.14564 type:complete len:323 (-) Transcript_7066:825-1793(-)|eukprot:CAMPEP_0184685280 /NCGR_PEP_ID=MMETSP0312-20130426/18341_1 /TAXON_ID=31354 /ORGANISM="Compsopogon coeruleus, Strain SAG 36.94" /LENGTH=322 /DNA_ID=CAMNT_0027139207 /DNA_START=227 /DNA_END=1195 /DNA_ORIENTATION=+
MMEHEPTSNHNDLSIEIDASFGDAGFDTMEEDSKVDLLSSPIQHNRLGEDHSEMEIASMDSIDDMCLANDGNSWDSEFGPVAYAGYQDGDHVTIWNNTEMRKIAGNAAPLRRNLGRYLKNHPDCEVYMDQDIVASRVARDSAEALNSTHVAIWNRVEGRKIAGNAAPLKKNLARYLKNHPDCEIYDGQDKKLKPRSSLKKQTKKTTTTKTSTPRCERTSCKKPAGELNVHKVDGLISLVCTQCGLLIQTTQNEIFIFPFDPWLAGASTPDINEADLVDILSVDTVEYGEEFLDVEIAWDDTDQSPNCYLSLGSLSDPGFEAL